MSEFTVFTTPFLRSFTDVKSQFPTDRFDNVAEIWRRYFGNVAEVWSVHFDNVNQWLFSEKAEIEKKVI